MVGGAHHHPSADQIFVRLVLDVLPRLDVYACRRAGGDTYPQVGSADRLGDVSYMPIAELAHPLLLAAVPSAMVRMKRQEEPVSPLETTF